MAPDQVNCVPGTEYWACNIIPQSPYLTIRKVSYLSFQVEVKPGQSELAEDGFRAPSRLPDLCTCLSSAGASLRRSLNFKSCLMSG